MNLSDTIVAVSSAPGGFRSIVRLTGPRAIAAARQVFTPHDAWQSAGVMAGSIALDADLRIEGHLYLFVAPHSYTGDSLAEIHLEASKVLVETLVEKFLGQGLRPAGPGEFTARAYLNGKLDLAQAEAVNEIIAGSNRFQLDAAERLLSGRLSQQIHTIREGLLDCLSLIEAGLDFSEEPIEFISTEQALERLGAIRSDLESLLAGSIRYESLIDLPAVGIAGAPNAGKSSLLNALLGQDRSIVSDQRKTTRDVLSGLFTTERCQCVLFDCAGLLVSPEGILDRLAQQAAIEALRHCQAILFCVDATKSDLSEDLAVLKLIESRPTVYIATKCDLPSHLGNLQRSFGTEFLPTSAHTQEGLDELKRRVEDVLCGAPPQDGNDAIALTTRHKQVVGDALETITQASSEIEQGSEETAAAMLRAAYEALSDIETQPVDEQLLDRIFGRFCIGK